MSAGTSDRIKRRLLQQAVAENLETMRGLPPRGIRRRHSLWQVWLKRAPLVLVPLTLAGSTFFVSSNGSHASLAPPAQRTSLMPTPAPHHLSAAVMALPTVDNFSPIDSAAFPLPVHRVVLDAGHGGLDPGASLDKLNEKEVTLDIERRLGTMLRASGFEVVLTRPIDQTVPLRERARLANSSSSDIFVSIHVNSVHDPRSRGIETYYLGPTNDPSLTKLAAAENVGSGYSLADVRKLLDGIYADVRRDESRRLAGSVQQQLFGNLKNSEPGLRDWGVKRAPFLVLVATEMPAILAEVGCISNPEEAARLAKPEYRQQIAEALFRGIHDYASANVNG